MKKIIILCLLITVVLIPVQTDAFWWLFGKTEDEVNLTYLYINGISYDESGEEITLYRDLLEEGLINIRGRAVIRNGEIGSVLVSIDGKETWESAELSDDGAFQYYFRPESGQTYEIYIEAMETAGRINNVDETYKRVIVSGSDYKQVINERLAALFTAYEMRDSIGFMDYVSWDFVGGDIVLEQALNKDFSNFADIEIEYSVLNYSINNEGMFSTVLEYKRRLIGNSDGRTLTDSGITEFIFNLEDRGPVLYSMSYPLIFGISDAVNVASGVINSAENEQVIAVDDQGNIELRPIEEVAADIPDDGTEDEEQEPNYRYGEVYLSHILTGYGESYSENYQAYNFSEDTVLDLDWDTGTFPGGDPDVIVTDAPDTGVLYGLMIEPEIGYIMLNESDINNVTEVPAEGYSYEFDDFNPGYLMEPGRCYALSLPDGNYAVVYYEPFVIIEQNSDPDNRIFWERTTLYYKYRDDGGRQF